jgi:iron-sulfur cluster assembly accessory protein
MQQFAQRFAVSERAAARIAEIIAAESRAGTHAADAQVAVAQVAVAGHGATPAVAQAAGQVQTVTQGPPEGTPGGATPAPALRVAVLAGGCSGFQYRFELDRAQQADDLVIEHSGARVVVDPVSLDLLAGGELDFTDELMGSHFAVRNPNAKSACGCGTSFSMD